MTNFVHIYLKLFKRAARLLFKAFEMEFLAHVPDIGFHVLFWIYLKNTLPHPKINFKLFPCPPLCSLCYHSYVQKSLLVFHWTGNARLATRERLGFNLMLSPTASTSMGWMWQLSYQNALTLSIYDINLLLAKPVIHSKGNNDKV